MTNATVSKASSSLSLMDLREKFGLERDYADLFFKQWLVDGDSLSSYDEQTLDRLRRNYRNIIDTRPLEEVVKLVVLAPLLELAGFYQPPFSIRAEVPTRLTVADQSEAFTGKIDVLVISQAFWVLVIESKQAQFDILTGIPQALSYLLSQPPKAQVSSSRHAKSGLGEHQSELPLGHLHQRFGMVTNGREVVFLKLTPASNERSSPHYSQSKAYQVIDEDEDLPQILRGLKWVGRYAIAYSCWQ
ncbi:MAG: type I restriction endonuclease subunit R [Moorea sp. SIO3C2]|nr:type I restriction endonuclease subunit R [Moorena sp. SIO3C2]